MRYIRNEYGDKTLGLQDEMLNWREFKLSLRYYTINLPMWLSQVIQKRKRKYKTTKRRFCHLK